MCVCVCCWGLGFEGFRALGGKGFWVLGQRRKWPKLNPPPKTITQTMPPTPDPLRGAWSFVSLLLM